jgi:hypothetical protein
MEWCKCHVNDPDTYIPYREDCHTALARGLSKVGLRSPWTVGIRTMDKEYYYEHKTAVYDPPGRNGVPSAIDDLGDGLTDILSKGGVGPILIRW